MGSCQSSEDAIAHSPTPAQQPPKKVNNAVAVVDKRGEVISSSTHPVSPETHTSGPETDATEMNLSMRSEGRTGDSASRATGNGYASSGDLSSATDAGSVGSATSRSSGGRGLKKINSKMLGHSTSVIGLDDMIENRREEGGFRTNMVHMEVPFGKPIEEVYDGVHSGPVLGSGISGTVRLVSHKATGVKYAVKCLDLGLVDTEEGLQQLREEIFIMCQLDHPNIVRLEEVYESHSEIYLVQELCLGGELFDRLEEQPDYHYTEAECARLIKNMLCAVRYLHSKGIIHRDLKLENFLFSSTSQDSELKMIDFGLSKHFRFGEVQHEAVGTPYTVAPEVIHGSYDERCDIWAIGVISFLLLSGEPPFGGCGGPEPLLEVRANILEGLYEFEPEEIWNSVSSGAKQFIGALLVTDPKQRPTASGAQKHLWLREWASRQRTQDDNVLNPNVVKALVNFKEFSDMRKLLCEVLSFTLLPDQIKELRREFEKMDTDGSGEISLVALKQVLLTNAGAGSLGALTEEEVEDIFNAMRVNKSETRIHWHEFIAAGLSQCQVDDRNLRLAFDRLDSDHKGYITLDDIMDLMGDDGVQSERMMRSMWTESMKSVACRGSRITYDKFILLMKGQTEVPQPQPQPMPASARLGPLGAVPEGKGMPVETITEGVPVTTSPELTKSILTHPLLLESKSEDNVSMHSLPEFPSHDGIGSSDSSLVIDSPAQTAHKVMEPTPVEPPEGGIEKPTGMITEGMEKPSLGGRRRSYSLTDKELEDSTKQAENSPFTPDSRRAVNLPEHDHTIDFEASKNKSALVVNRQLYRAHRQMRISVMEASRRFEEQQARRARDTLVEQVRKAGLVMRHGHRVQVTSESIRALLDENKAEQQEIVEKANRRGGRGRASRKKTISDIRGMMATSMGQDENADKVSSKTPTTSTSMFQPSGKKVEMPNLTEGKASSVSLSPAIGGISMPPVSVVDTEIRKPTVPGEFRKTKDPFSSEGMYGGSRIGDHVVNDIRTDIPK